MCVVAHPDDECFAFGGALLLAAQAGWETNVLCLTDGQAATNRGNAADGAELGRIRRSEFAQSCALLGVRQHELLTYGDGTLEFADTDRVTRELVERIRRFRPEVVLTFGLDGGLNVHADHAMVSAFTTLAYHWSGRPKRFPDIDLEAFAPDRLYHASTVFTLEDRETLHPAPWSVKLDIRSVKKIKEDAMRAHTSQAAILEKIQPWWDRYGDAEYYTLAAGSTPQPAHLSQTLF